MHYLIYENYKSKRTDFILSERNEKKQKSMYYLQAKWLHSRKYTRLYLISS